MLLPYPSWDIKHGMVSQVSDMPAKPRGHDTSEDLCVDICSRCRQQWHYGCPVRNLVTAFYACINPAVLI